MVQRAVDLHIVQCLQQPHAQPLAQAHCVTGYSFSLLGKERSRLAESNDAGHVERPGAKALLLVAPHHLRLEQHGAFCPPHIQGADTLGSIEFVS